jgi:hypothetical protein
VDALTRDLGAARAEIEAVKTETAAAIQAQVEAARMKQAAEIAAAAQALVRERERADAITRDLAAARTEIDALKAPAALSPAITSSTVPLHRPGEAHDRKLVSVSPQRSERDQPPKGPAVASASVLDLKIASRGEPLPVPSSEAPAAAFGGVRPAQAAPASEDEARTLARAEALIRQGDIKGARLVLERATGAGGAHAWFALAETYDPRMLSSWRTFGIRGEPEKARELYGRAYAAGMIEAKERGETLK